MAPFYGWGSTASRLQPLRGGSLLFTIQFPEIPVSSQKFLVTLESINCLFHISFALKKWGGEKQKS